MKIFFYLSCLVAGTIIGILVWKETKSPALKPIMTILVLLIVAVIWFVIAPMDRQ